MPLNIPGLLVPFQLLFNPRIVLPSIIVKDIRHLDFAALHKAGYRGAVFDKDNCLTRPYKDTVVPEIEQAWHECRKTFGPGNVLIVSNSAGTWLDPGAIQCESVTHNTGAPYSDTRLSNQPTHVSPPSVTISHRFVFQFATKS
ncbi:mitochondrial PGP phosphatase-domain-containing protein [Lyophyllum atratum]|nr:mitochondrial PGP phosphatase-domain-containing protein [Lyophyllum atratum]